MTDGAGNVTSMGYDLLGRKTAMSDPDMGQWQYQYDAAGNLTAQRDGRGLWLYLGYDALNRLVTKRQDDPVAGSLLADYSYDAPGQLGLPRRSRAYSAAGVVEVQAVVYDSRGQVTEQQWLVPGSGGGTFRLDTAYNAAGQKAALTYPGGSGGQLGEVVSFGYDAIGQLTSVGGAGVQYLSGATYNAQGQPLELVNDSGANGLRRQYGYESNTQRLSVLRAGKTSPYTGLQELTYSYDNAGNVTSIVDGRNSSQRQCFQYDWLDRLTGAFTGDAACSAYSAVGVGAYNHSYAYDAIGNLTSYAGSSYTYGLTNAQPHAVTGAHGNSYDYDANGNQVRRTIAGVEYTLVYDYGNRLVAVQQGETLIASFLYDAAGNRVKGSVGGITTVYVAGLYEQSGAASTSYYEGGAMRRSGYASSNGVFYLLTDQLKSTSIIADQAGAEAARQFFYPYGANRGGAAFSELTTKRFTGQYHEQGLPGAEGLSYYNARWYDPQLGRFTSPDTIVPGPDSPQAINRYSYGYNNPPTNLDTSGHAAHKAGTEVWNKERIRALVAKSMEILRKQVKPRIYYLNGLGGNKDLQPSSNPVAEYEYTYYKLQQYGGSAQVVHIPLFTDGRSTRWQRLEMLQEAFLPSKPWTDIAVKMISDDINSRPLASGQQVVLVGSSAGGTVAIEALPFLEKMGIHVKQVVLRGSFVGQFSLSNVDRVDYLAADPPWSDPYHSIDVNPFDAVVVSEHIVPGLHGHKPDANMSAAVWSRVGDMVVDLIATDKP